MSARRLGDLAPDFEQPSSLGPIRLREWLGDGWGVLFSHPADFTPVCTSELGTTSKLKDEFARRNVNLIALSVDPPGSHTRWIGDIDCTQQMVLEFPVIADADRKVSEHCDPIHRNAGTTANVRSVFVIDPARKVRLRLTCPASTGRDFDELLRMIDSLQPTDRHSVATPANRKQGDDAVILLSLQDPELIEQKFAQGHQAVTPYLRLRPQPAASRRV